MESVSVIIPAYNSAEYILDCLSSVFKQTYLPSEVIVIDDGSTDRTAEIVKGFSRVRYIYQKNQGLSAARNMGIKNSTGKWLAFLDSDDAWKEDHLEKVIFTAKTNGLMWAFGNKEDIDYRTGKKITASCSKDVFKMIKNGCIDDFYKGFLRSIPALPSGLLIDRDVVKNIGYFDEQINIYEDIDYFLRIALKHPRVGFVVSPTVMRKIRKDSLSRSGKEDTFIKIIDKLFEISSAAGEQSSERILPIAALLARISLHRAICRKDSVKIISLLDKYPRLLPKPDRYIGQMALFIPRTSKVLLLLFRKWKEIYCTIIRIVQL